MSSEWDSVEIGAVAKLRSGFPFKSADWTDEGVPVIKIANVKNGRIVRDGCGFVAPEVAQRTPEWFTKDGDVLIAMTGYVGEVALVQTGEQYLINQRVGRFEFHTGAAVDPKFFFYHLQLPATRSEIEGVARGSAQPNLSAADAHKIKLTLPPVAIQKEISGILGALDDRITLLRETNTTLEAIAQALFKSWFVDFDPVHAKMQGRAPEGMGQATAALFPDSFEDSELGPVPKGWRVQKFGDFIDRKSVGKKFDQKTAFASGQVPILDQGKSGVIGFHNEEPGIKASLERPVVVFANHTCNMRLICFDFSAIQNVLPFIGKGVDTVWAFYATKDRVKFSEYKGHWPDFAIERAVVPSVEFTEVFRHVVDPLIACIRNNELQIQNMAALRDTLLPRLISGQLRIEEAAEALA